MSLDKAILHGKEHRKQYYRRCYQIDPSCRNHGSCDYCRSSRLIQEKREKERTEYEEE